ncbi:hypothetical protein DFA_02063 [Cavenderia fasciculata]|uniref:Uncharacterized protein n=1 Tax=Cavenderia fasciculata TaxID=261658 RepID=F4PYL0_CACFS|nr:uncharacterized protein DFA_02063 [Cavenderia fasciculata]EGG19276.1 hypothetical protein DFA_02063 [Cavenderia fasciculata]|eukprot:XP_004357547.1 hypothetical protein DFA_02063 [Cavenderia fasciculata]
MIYVEEYENGGEYKHELQYKKQLMIGFKETLITIYWPRGPHNHCTSGFSASFLNNSKNNQPLALHLPPFNPVKQWDDCVKTSLRIHINIMNDISSTQCTPSMIDQPPSTDPIDLNNNTDTSSLTATSTTSTTTTNNTCTSATSTTNNESAFAISTTIGFRFWDNTLDIGTTIGLVDNFGMN